MQAFVVTAPGRAGIEEVEPPVAVPGEAVVEVARAGVCGTDVEFFTGQMQYLHDGHAAYPMRLGHEWCGTVVDVGDGVARAWLGRRVTGDTMLGCGSCRRCGNGRQHLCAHRTELGIRGGRPGALAERVAVPAAALHVLPETLDDITGAMVEPGGNALRAVRAAAVGEGDRLLVMGPGTIGLLAAMFARARGAEVHLLGLPGPATEFARTLGFDGVWTAAELPDLRWDAIIDASTSPDLPARAAELVEPGGRIVCVGLSGTPSLVDSRVFVLADVTVVGILSASPALGAVIEAYAGGEVDPRVLVATSVGLDGVTGVLAGDRPPGAGTGPKIHVTVS